MAIEAAPDAANRQGAELAERPLALVVEDEFLIALEMAEVIEQAGWRVLGPTVSVAETLRLLESERPDLALVDVRLGEETSAAVVSRLAALGVPVVLSTAYPDPALVAGAVFAGLPKLGKPVDRRTLLAVVDRARGITYRIDPERRIVFLFGRGALRVADALDLQNRLRADPEFDPSFRMLADYRAAVSVQVESQRLHEVAANAPFAARSRRAFVVQGAVNYGVMRRFQALSEVEPRHGEVGVFYQFEAALSWLDET